VPSTVANGAKTSGTIKCEAFTAPGVVAGNRGGVCLGVPREETMTRCVSGVVVAGVLAMTLGVAARQAGEPKSVTASVTVTTSDSRRNVAVLSKGEPPFLRVLQSIRRC